MAEALAVVYPATTLQTCMTPARRAARAVLTTAG